MRLWESRTPPGFILGAADREIRGPPFFCPGRIPLFTAGRGHESPAQPSGTPVRESARRGARRVPPREKSRRKPVTRNL